MVVAQRYNLQKNALIDIVYGCISTGSIWRFLKLVEQTLFIDAREYYLDALDKIMGILAQYFSALKIMAQLDSGA